MADGDVTYTTGDLADGYACGTFTSIGGTGDVKVLCGFKPRRVILRSTGPGRAKSEWHAGIDDGVYFRIVSTPRYTNVVLGDGIELYDGKAVGLQADGSTWSDGESEGFLIPAGMEQFNQSASEVNFWEAWR